MTVESDAIPPRPEEEIAAIDQVYHIDETSPTCFTVQIDGRNEYLTCDNGNIVGFDTWEEPAAPDIAAEIRYDIQQVCSVCNPYQNV